jgi:hypothetical protein
VFNESSFRIATQAAFLARTLASSIQTADETNDLCALANVSQQIQHLIAEAQTGDTGLGERLELLAALTESAETGYVPPAHRFLLKHLAAGQRGTATIQ